MPRVGQFTTVRGMRCEIIAVHPFGTIDVHVVGTEIYWRVSGLALGDE